MAGAKREPVLFVTPTKVVLVSHGQVGIQTQTISLVSGEGEFESVDAAVREAARRAGLQRGERVRVVYESETGDAEVTAFGGSASQAIGAATVVISEHFPHGIPARAASIIPMPSQLTQAAQEHQVLAVADTEAALGEIASAVEAAGLRFVGAYLHRAVLLEQVVRVASESETERTAYCLIGTHGGAIGSAQAGRIAFARGFSIGAYHLASAIDRALRGIQSQTGIGQVEGTARGHRIFERFGIPQPDTLIEQSPAILGRDLLPALQPVLQRMAIELKQTIRFGAPEGVEIERVLLIGPYAHLPGFAASLSEAVEVPVAVQAEQQAADCDPEAYFADIPNWLPQLQTREALIARRDRRMRWASRAGIAACAALVLGHAAGIAKTRAEIRDERQAINGRLAAARSVAEEAELTLALSESVQAGLEASEASLGAVIDWAAAAYGISNATARVPVTVQEMSGEAGRDGPSLRLIGLAPVRAGENNTITELITEIMASGLFESVELGTARIEVVEDIRVRRFEIRAIPKPVPPALVRYRQSAGEWGGTHE